MQNYSKEYLQAHEDRKQKIIDSIPSSASSDERWRILRQCSIGASDIAAVMGINSYKSKYQLWLEKTGRTEPFKGNSATHWGQILEKVLLEEFQRVTGQKVITMETISNKDLPYMTYSPDGVIVDQNNQPLGLWEAKTAKMNVSTGEIDEEGRTIYKWGEGDIYENDTLIKECNLIPDEYMLQVQAGMLISNASFCKLSALITTSDFRNYTIRKNAELQEEIVRQVKDFWENNVLADVAPQKTLNDLKSIHDVQGKVKEGNAEIETTLLAYKEFLQQEKTIKGQIDILKAQLITFIDDAQSVIDSNGKTLYSFKSQPGRSSIDMKSLERDRPDLYKLIKESYTTHSSAFRVLRVATKR